MNRFRERTGAEDARDAAWESFLESDDWTTRLTELAHDELKRNARDDDVLWDCARDVLAELRTGAECLEDCYGWTLGDAVGACPDLARDVVRDAMEGSMLDSKGSVS